MKNAYALKLAAQRTAREVQAHQDGAQFALNLCAVALNNVYGFGRERLERLERLEREVNRLLEEEFGHDLELAAEGLARRIEQIRGENHG